MVMWVCDGMEGERSKLPDDTQKAEPSGEEVAAPQNKEGRTFSRR